MKASIPEANGEAAVLRSGSSAVSEARDYGPQLDQMRAPLLQRKGVLLFDSPLQTAKRFAGE